MIIPVVILDFFTEMYHRVCFPVYGLKYVNRSDYVRIDRHRLAYLPFYDKVNCAFCGYVNGLLRYAVAIAAETERYWCGIKHQQGGKFRLPVHQKDFLAYGDEKAYREFIQKR